MAEKPAEPPPAPKEVHVPHIRVIMAVSFIVLAAFALVSLWVLTSPNVDAGLKGSIIQTWNNATIAVVGFWVGSSLGGKMASRPPS